MTASASAHLNRRIFVRAVVPMLAIIALLGACFTVAATSSAWTDQSLVAASASAGTWETAPAPTGPLTPGPDTALGKPTWTIPADATATFCFTATATTTSKTPVAWSVNANLNAAPFWGAKNYYYTGSSQVNISTTATTAKITGVGTGNGAWNASWNNAKIVAGQPVTFTICNSQPANPPAADASFYTVSSAASGEWTAKQACVVTTITSTQAAADYPFFHGWKANVNLVAAKKFITGKGGKLNYVSWTPSATSDGYWFATNPADSGTTADTFALTSGPAGAIKAGQATVIKTCVNGS